MGLRKSAQTGREWGRGGHRFEHWYRDNSVYFITGGVRGGVPLLQGEGAREIFWRYFEKYAERYGFVAWVTTVMSNHYHVLGYLAEGAGLGEMMRRVHGAVAWEVGKRSRVRHVPFWEERGGRDYFDRCVRDVEQAEAVYRYVLMQGVRAGVVREWREYEGTRVRVEMGEAIRTAIDAGAFLERVPKRRREGRRGGGRRGSGMA